MTLHLEAKFEVLVNELWSVRDPTNLYWHINLKEIKAAIMTIIAIAEAVPEDLRRDTVIVFGEDNTTALAALNSFNYPKDARTCGELMLLHEKLGGVELAVFYVNTKIIPADDLTRDKQPEALRKEAAHREKCRRTRAQLVQDYEDRGSCGTFF